MGSRDDRCWCQKRQSAGQNWLGDSLESLRGGARLQGSKKLYGGGQIAAHLHPKEVFAVVEREVGALSCGMSRMAEGNRKGVRLKLSHRTAPSCERAGGAGGAARSRLLQRALGANRTKPQKWTIFFERKTLGITKKDRSVARGGLPACGVELTLRRCGSSGRPVQARCNWSDRTKKQSVKIQRDGKSDHNIIFNKR
jgi:hypothetical protein